MHDDIFTGPLSACAGRLLRTSDEESIPAGEILGAGRLEPLLTHHHQHTGGDWRAACSFWTQFYFGTLIVPAVATALLGQEPMPLGVGDLRIVFCPDRSVPRAFLRRPMSPAPTMAGCFASLLDDHLAPLAAAICRAVKLSEKLVWENAAWPLAFALRCVVDRRSTCMPAVEAVLDWPACPRAGQKALSAVRHMVLNGAGFERRLCCLRYRLPGLCHCAGQCPLLSPGATS